MFNFKIFAILMCPGHPRDKAAIMFDMVYGKTDPCITSHDLDHLKIGWKNPRLYKVVQQLFYFSQIFPKEYQNYFNSTNPNSISPRVSARSSDTWCDDYLTKCKKTFPLIFDQIYEEEFVENTFENYRNLITRENF